MELSSDRERSYSLTFGEVAPFYSHLNPGVKIEYDKVSAKTMVEDLSAALKDSPLNGSDAE